MKLSLYEILKDISKEKLSLNEQLKINSSLATESLLDKKFPTNTIKAIEYAKLKHYTLHTLQKSLIRKYKKTTRS